MKTSVGQLFSRFKFIRIQKEIFLKRQVINQNQFDTGINKRYRFPSPMFYVSGLCTVLLVFVHGRVKCLFSVSFVLNPLFVNVLFCDKQFFRTLSF